MLCLVSLLMVASCSHEIETITYQEKQKQDFVLTFERTFGKPDSKQDWGFDGVEVVDLVNFQVVLNDWTTDEVINVILPSRGNTRSHNVERNNWANNFIIPSNVTASERNLVIAEFSKERIGAVNTENVNWTDYFIYEVYKGEASYKDGFGQNVVGSDHMNHLQVKYADGGLTPPNNACWEHANDFNNRDHNSKWGNIEGATLMINSGTLDFAYHNSTDNKYHSEYIIIAGADIDASLDGYYYVGFDFCASHPEGQESNKNMDVERDWVFNDWIVRISPATFKAAKRIIAEDLAADEGSDFDYNDVVFDATLANEWVASLNANKLVAHITLRAAGGTMPLYVADKEVHQLFGVDCGTMVNTGRTSRPYVQFTTVIGDADWSNTKTIKDIPIKVITNNGEIYLGSNKGEASEKLCVDKSYVWCSERQPIQEKYPKFPRFVTDRTVKWYEVY